MLFIIKEGFVVVMLKWLLLVIQFMLVVSSTHQLSECVLVHWKIKVFVYAMAFCNALILAFKWLKKKLEAWIKVEQYPCNWISYLLWMISVPLIWPIRLKEKSPNCLPSYQTCSVPIWCFWRRLQRCHWSVVESTLHPLVFTF